MYKNKLLVLLLLFIVLLIVNISLNYREYNRKDLKENFINFYFKNKIY